MMELRELIIDPDEEMMGVDAISLVKYPAIEENWVYFSKQFELVRVDEERQMLVGPALIPDKKIYRQEMDGTGYEVFFTAETVQKAAHLFMRRSRMNAATVEHEAETSDVYVYESWVVEDPKMDKQNVYGFSFPRGTWMVAMRVDDAKLWQGVKDGQFRGFSIEGYFVDQIVNDKSKADMKWLPKVRGWKQVKAYDEMQLQDGTKIVTEADSFEPGVKVSVMDDEGKPSDAPKGEHTLANGQKIVVGEGGILESIGAEEAKPEATEENKQDMGRVKMAEYEVEVDQRANDMIEKEAKRLGVESSSPLVWGTNEIRDYIGLLNFLNRKRIKYEPLSEQEMGRVEMRVFEVAVDDAATEALEKVAKELDIDQIAPNLWGTIYAHKYRDLIKFLDSRGFKYVKMGEQKFGKYDILVEGNKRDIERLLQQGDIKPKAGKIDDFGYGEVMLAPRNEQDAKEVQNYLAGRGTRILHVSFENEFFNNPDMNPEAKKPQDEEKKDKMGYRSKIKEKLQEADISESVAENLTEAIVAIVEEAAEPIVEEVVEEKVEEVKASSHMKELLSAVEELKAANNELNTRLKAMEEAPAASFTHAPNVVTKKQSNIASVAKNLK